VSLTFQGGQLYRGAASATYVRSSWLMTPNAVTRKEGRGEENLG
jgi:hypothetical protein